jgi:hypothetical protein
MLLEWPDPNLGFGELLAKPGTICARLFLTESI